MRNMNTHSHLIHLKKKSTLHFVFIWCPVTEGSLIKKVCVCLLGDLYSPVLVMYLQFTHLLCCVFFLLIY